MSHDSNNQDGKTTQTKKKGVAYTLERMRLDRLLVAPPSDFSSQIRLEPARSDL